MFSFFITSLRLLKAVYRSAYDKEFRALALMTSILLFSGTLYYAHAENWSIVDSLYFCVMTMTKIGYGDLVPTTATSKIFTILYAFISIGVFVSLSAKIAGGLFRNGGISSSQRSSEQVSRKG